jgi:hypothetical protein
MASWQKRHPLNGWNFSIGDDMGVFQQNRQILDAFAPPRIAGAWRDLTAITVNALVE